MVIDFRGPFYFLTSLDRCLTLISTAIDFLRPGRAYHDLTAGGGLNDEMDPRAGVVCFIADRIPAFMLGAVNVAPLFEQVLRHDQPLCHMEPLQEGCLPMHIVRRPCGLGRWCARNARSRSVLSQPGSWRVSFYVG